MKKLILLLVLWFLNLGCCFSQIQRTFLGCSFGCTKQVAVQKIKALGYNIHKTEEGFTAEHKVSQTVKFGGYTWEFVEFKFHKNHLYNVLFCNSAYTDQAKTIAQIAYKELKEKLGKKYINNSKSDWGVAGISWTDSRTGVICRTLYVNNLGETSYQDSSDKHLNLYLWYYDKLTLKTINKAENNEL